MDAEIWVAVATIVAALVAVIGAYFFGASSSRNERRDAALAEIYKEMTLFYRGVVAWTSQEGVSRGPITEPETSWDDYCKGQYEVFLRAFYGNAIWLGRSTERMIQEFADAGRDLLNGIDQYGRHMPDGKSVWDWRARELRPKLDMVEDALRAEVEMSRSVIPWGLIASAIERVESRSAGGRKEDR